MCGVAGFAWKEIGRPADIKVVRGMADSISHRGPYDQGFFGAQPVACDRPRLSIIDLTEGGHKLMRSDDGALIIIFNSEIYNQVEIREELQLRRFRFHFQSDTEIVLAGYRAWGEDCVRRFHGMWVSAIYEQTCDTVFFCRDRLGIMPLYHSDRGSCFVFCSEIKGIVTALEEVRKVNYAYLRHFLPLGEPDDGAETMFEGVLSPEAGHMS